VTNSLAVAGVCAEFPAVATYVIGGRLMAGSLSMIGPQAERELTGISADWAFLGAAAIEGGGAFTSADPYEAEVKRAMIKAARRTAVLADETKFGTRRFAAFARAEDIDCLVTTPACPPDVKDWLEGAGASLVLSAPLETG
jgi:DeoR/GlpR family transcriptional regulator of sugar metabolism